MNRKLILNLTFPLTIIIFILFTKWWIVDVIDGTDAIMYGFPFIYKSPAFYTSMAVEYFIIELIADILLYFGTIIGIIFLINKFIFQIKVRKKVTSTLYIFAGILIIFELLIASLPENMFSFNRNYDIIIKQRGFDYPFNSNDKREFDKYHK